MSAFTFVGEITVFHSKMHILALLSPKGCEWKFAAIFGHSWFQLNLTKKFMGCGDSLQNVRSYDVSKNFRQHFMDVCFAKILILMKNVADRFERVCLLKSLCNVFQIFWPTSTNYMYLLSTLSQSNTGTFLYRSVILVSHKVRGIKFHKLLKICKF